ncbi:unnamed protein product [Clonostachys byssicola]|uniref:Zn(2)-C6 fungal-type domain-containing protein n=1 Tax=Clonostachys byssicola TaxID=160290 RepID=A0A9N9UPQ8_9HYPO|nr:unnamed protein product [Clonostachys byssicola]
MPVSRAKACFLCREAKARCDRATPECSRCAARKLRCVYDGRNGSRGAVPSYPYPSRVALQSLMPQEIVDPLALLGDQQQQDDSFVRLLSSSAETPQRLEVAEPADDDAWTADGLLGRDPSMDPLLGLDLTGDTFALGNNESRNFAEKETISPNLMKPWGLAADTEDSNVYSHGTWAMHDIANSPTATTQKDLAVLTSTSTVTTPVDTDKSGSLGHPLLMNSLFRSCTMNSILLGQLTSYPKMMIEGDQLPPFIHAPCHIDNDLAPGCGESGRHQCLPKELAICASLVQMFYERTNANTDFVWNLIYEEQARLHRECFVEHMARTNEWATDARDAVSNRREWVFRESIRRVLVVLHIVARLLDGFVRGGCTPAPGSSFRTIPLPSSRDLWEARTSRVWTRDYKKNMAARTTDKVLTVGDVLESGGVSRSCSGKGPTTPELLPEVMRRAGGLDTLGMLVWMVMPFEDAREVHEHEAMICWS